MNKKKVLSIDLEKYVTEMQRVGFFSEKKNDFAVLCPMCMEEKRSQGIKDYRKLKLWVIKDYGYGHCFRCGTVFLSDDGSINTNVKKLEKPVDMSNWKVSKLGSDGYWSLDRFKEFDEYDQKGVDYLAKERLYLYRKMYKILGIRFKDSNPVLPFYYKGEIINYQMRIIDPKSKIKYYTPSCDHKNPYILESKDTSKWIISEGAFDAVACRLLYPEYSAFAVLGSDITDYQIGMLRTYVPEEIIIFMDYTKLSYKIKESIEKYINYAKITIHNSDGTDPEEHYRLKLIREEY